MKKQPKELKQVLPFAVCKLGSKLLSAPEKFETSRGVVCRRTRIDHYPACVSRHLKLIGERRNALTEALMIIIKKNSKISTFSILFISSYMEAEENEPFLHA